MFLEDQVDAKRVCWFGENLNAVSCTSRGSLHHFLVEKLVTCVPQDVLYAKEVVLLAAHASLLPRASTGVYKVPRHLITSKRLSLDRQTLQTALEHTLRTGTDDINVFRLYVHIHVERYLRDSMAHVAVPVDRKATHEQARRVARLLRAFSREVTFKVHGDASLHAEIITCMLPCWMPTMLAHLETPFQLSASSFPTQVNDMVRPILETPARDRIDHVKFNQRHTIRDAIVAGALLCELIGQGSVKLLTNATITRIPSADPLLFVMSNSAGEQVVGVRQGTTLHVFDSSHTTCDILVVWLEMCREFSVDGTQSAAGVVLDETTDVNPLAKYLTRHLE